MAWFKSKTESAGKVDIERVVKALEAMDYSLHRVPGEQLAGANFNDIPMLFDASNDEFLRVHAMPEIFVTPEQRAQALQFCNDWNADSLWGTAYLYDDDEDQTTKLCVDVSNRIKEGLTDEQLNTLLDLSLTVTIDCVETYNNGQKGTEA